MGKLLKHLKTIRIHRKYVRKMCFKMGIPWQGLVHDLSKYSPAELSICKYWTGKGSPHQAAREAIGYSPSWIHHYHKNKHHHMYWLDTDEYDKMIPIKMPYKYVIESLCDMVGASKAYNKEKFEPGLVWKYWVEKCRDYRPMHEESKYLLEKLIWNYYQMGEEDFLKWYKQAKKYLLEHYNEGDLIKEKFSEREQ